MAKRSYQVLSALLAIYIVGIAAYAAMKPTPADPIDANNTQLIGLGQQVYATRCAACHGAKLEGQPDWHRPGSDGRLPAPPHDESGHTWHHGERYLIHVVERGIVAGEDRPPGYVGNMPAFGGILTRAEIVAVLSYIKSTWSYDYRAWQDRVTLAEQAALASGQKQARTPENESEHASGH